MPRVAQLVCTDTDGSKCVLAVGDSNNPESISMADFKDLVRDAKDVLPESEPHIEWLDS